LGLQINLCLQQQLIVLIVSLPLGLHPSPLGGFILLHLGLRPSPLGPLACIWPVLGFSSFPPSWKTFALKCPGSSSGSSTTSFLFLLACSSLQFAPSLGHTIFSHTQLWHVHPYNESLGDCFCKLAC